MLYQIFSLTLPHRGEVERVEGSGRLSCGGSRQEERVSSSEGRGESMGAGKYRGGVRVRMWYYHNEEEVGSPSRDESESKRGEVAIFVIQPRYMQSNGE